MINFDLIAAKLEEAKALHLRELNRAIFDVGAFGPVGPLTRRERFGLKLARVRGYFMRLWYALRGRDPYDHEYDY